MTIVPGSWAPGHQVVGILEAWEDLSFILLRPLKVPIKKRGKKAL